MPEPVNISEIVASSFSDLKAVSVDLNKVSDELGKSVSQIDDVLRTLNLGITVWARIRGGSGDQSEADFTYWSEDLGYTKHQGRWGICLRQVSGDVASDHEDVEIWHFNDAPRALRLSAIDCIVKLLQKLSEEGRATAQKIKEKLSEAQEVAGAITKAAISPRRANFNIPAKGAK